MRHNISGAMTACYLNCVVRIFCFSCVLLNKQIADSKNLNQHRMCAKTQNIFLPEAAEKRHDTEIFCCDAFCKPSNDPQLNRSLSVEIPAEIGRS